MEDENTGTKKTLEARFVIIVNEEESKAIDLVKLVDILDSHASKQFISYASDSFKGVKARTPTPDQVEESVIADAYITAVKTKVDSEIQTRVEAVYGAIEEENDETEQTEDSNQALFIILSGTVEHANDISRLLDAGIVVCSVISVAAPTNQVISAQLSPLEKSIVMMEDSRLKEFASVRVQQLCTNDDNEDDEDNDDEAVVDIDLNAIAEGVYERMRALYTSVCEYRRWMSAPSIEMPSAEMIDQAFSSNVLSTSEEKDSTTMDDTSTTFEKAFNDLEVYNNTLKAIPASSVNVKMVLFALFEQVAHSVAEATKREEEQAEQAQDGVPNDKASSSVLRMYAEETWTGLSPITSSRSLKTTQPDNVAAVKLLNAQDSNAIALARAGSTDSHQHIMKCAAEISSHLPMLGVKRAGMPEYPALSQAERGVDMTSRMSCTKLTERVYTQAMYCNVLDKMMLEFVENNEVDAKVPPRDWKFGKRVARENFRPNEFAQVLEDMLYGTPLPIEMRSAYVPERDELALIVHVNTPHLREKTKQWFSYVNSDVNYADWTKLGAAQREVIPREILHIGSGRGNCCGKVESTDLCFSLSDQGHLGRSTILSGQGESNAQVWLQLPSIFASLQRVDDVNTRELRVLFSNESQVIVRCKGDATSETKRNVSYVISSIGSDGAMASVHSSGQVVVQYADAHEHNGEVSRSVLPQSSSVCRVLTNGQRQELGRDSSVSMNDPKTGMHSSTSAEGVRTQVDSTNTTKLLRPYCIASQSDSESSAVVTSREDHVALIQYDAETSVVLFADGTRMFHDGAQARTSVETPQLGAVELYHEGENSERVCVRVRAHIEQQAVIDLNIKDEGCSVSFEGFRLLTRLTSAGRSLRALLVPNTNDDDEICVPDDWATLENVARCYLFRLDEGSVSTLDAEDNFFAVDDSGAQTSRLSVNNNEVSGGDVADESEKIPLWYFAPIQYPLEPRAFIVSGDGYAMEFVRSCDTRNISKGDCMVLDDALGDHERSVRVLRQLKTRPRYMKNLVVPNVVSGGTGLTSVVNEKSVDVNLTALVVLRALRMYAELTDETREQANEDLEQFRAIEAQHVEDDQKFAADEELPDDAINEQQELQRAVIAEREKLDQLAARRLVFTPHEDDEVNDTSGKNDDDEAVMMSSPSESCEPLKPIELPPKRDVTKAVAPLNGFPTNFFDDEIASQDFRVEMAIHRILGYDCEHEFDDEDADDVRLGTLQAVSELQQIIERCFESPECNESCEQLEERFTINLEVSPGASILSGSIGLTNNAIVLMLALGLQQHEATQKVFHVVNLNRLRKALNGLSKAMAKAHERIRCNCETAQYNLTATPLVMSTRTETSVTSSPTINALSSDEKNKEQTEKVVEQCQQECFLPPLRTYAPAAVAVSINETFLQREHAARRKLRTTSSIKSAQAGVTAPVLIGENGEFVAFSRFKIQPARARFGRICADTTVRYGLRFTNVGYEIGRFRIDPATITSGDVEVRCVFRAGPIAPGMSVRVEVELYAPTSGMFNGNICVRSELETFEISFSGQALSQEQFLQHLHPDACSGRRSSVRVHCRGRVQDSSAGEMKAITKSSSSFEAKFFKNKFSPGTVPEIFDEPNESDKEENSLAEERMIAAIRSKQV